MATTEIKPPAQRTGVHSLRWWIISLVFLATLINYIDRLTISILAPVVCSDLHLSNLDYASINTWFLLSYSLGQTLFGKIHDRYGTRRGYGIAMAIWSFAEAAHARARSLFSLSAFRLALGVGESGQWPAATKVAAEWFPVEERALGMGIINTGAALGPVVAAPLVVWLQLRYGWQMTFLATGSLGLVWLALWFLFYRLPEHHRLITEEERDHILKGQEKSERTIAPGWKELFRYPTVWGIVLARFFGDPVWWLYLIWLPLYLHTARGFNMQDIGFFAWIPYLGAAAGSLLGGWTSGYLVARGWKTYHARAAAILFATMLAPSGLFIARARSPVVAMALISIVLFSFQFWVNNVQTLPSDTFPTGYVGSVAGMAGTAAGIGAMLLTMATGWVVDHFSYQPVLFASGFLVPLASLLLFLLIRPSSFRDTINPDPSGR